LVVVDESGLTLRLCCGLALCLDKCANRQGKLQI